MNYAITDSSEAVFKRFDVMSIEIKHLADIFQNPGLILSEEDALAWISEADTVHNRFVQLITDAVREIHCGKVD